MKLDAKTVKKLEKILEGELSLYVEYLAVLERERACVIALRAGEVNALSARRGEIVHQLSLLRDERTTLVEMITGGETRKLSDVVEDGCNPIDRKRLMSLISKIKDLLAKVEEQSREFNQVLSFTLGLVNGELSLLWSASQSVTRVYDSFGSLHEAAQPTAPRVGSLLGQA
jgi:hypothetical protein